MIFTQMKDTGKKLDLKWLEPDDHNPEQRIKGAISAKERPRKEFGEALQQFRELAARQMGIKHFEDIEGVRVTEVKVALDDNERRTLTVTATVPVKDAPEPGTFTTAPLREPDPDDSSDGQYGQRVARWLQKLEEEANVYLLGEREQGELFPKSTAAAALEKQKLEEGRSDAAQDEIDREAEEEFAHAGAEEDDTLPF